MVPALKGNYQIPWQISTII